MILVFITVRATKHFPQEQNKAEKNIIFWFDYGFY